MVNAHARLLFVTLPVLYQTITNKTPIYQYTKKNKTSVGIHLGNAWIFFSSYRVVQQFSYIIKKKKMLQTSFLSTSGFQVVQASYSTRNSRDKNTKKSGSLAPCVLARQCTRVFSIARNECTTYEQSFQHRTVFYRHFYSRYVMKCDICL